MNRLIVLLACLLAGNGMLWAQDLYDLDRIQEVRLEFPTDKWDGVLEAFKQAGKDRRMTGAAMVNGVRYDSVGIRYKGNSSYFNIRQSNQYKLPFNVKIDHKLEEQLLPGGYGTLKLSNVFRDPSFLREILAYEVIGAYIPSPRANFMKVYANDQYMGLYHSSESVDKKWLKDHYGEKNGIFFKCDPNWHIAERKDCPPGDKSALVYQGEDTLCYQRNYEIKSDHGWQELASLTQVLAKSPENIATVLDVDRVLWMHAFNHAVVNLDSYSGRLCHNYYLYRDSFGIFHPIPWDMNLSFGGFRYASTGAPLSNEELITLSPFVHYQEDNQLRPLIVQLINQPLYRKIYLAHLRTIADEWFYNGKLLSRARELHAFIRPEVVNDQNKLYTVEAFDKNLTTSAKADKIIIGLEELIQGRSDYLRQHPLLSKTPPGIEQVRHERVEAGLLISAHISGAEKSWLFFRTGRGPFVPLEMTASDNDMWTTTIPSEDSVQYYLVAEGEHLAQTSPARTGMEYYEFVIE